MEWSLGKRIKMARIQRDLSQRQLATKAGLRQSHLSLIENDKHDPGARVVRMLAEALGVTGGYLLGLSDRMDVEPVPADAA